MWNKSTPGIGALQIPAHHFPTLPLCTATWKPKTSTSPGQGCRPGTSSTLRAPYISHICTMASASVLRLRCCFARKNSSPGRKLQTRNSTWHLRNYGKSSKRAGGIRARTAKSHIVQKLTPANIDCRCTICQLSPASTGATGSAQRQSHTQGVVAPPTTAITPVAAVAIWPSCHTKGVVAAPQTATAMLAAAVVVSAPLGHQPLQPFLRQCWFAWTEAAQHLRREAPHVTPKSSALMLQDTHAQVLCHCPLTHCALISRRSVVAQTKLPS